MADFINTLFHLNLAPLKRGLNSINWPEGTSTQRDTLGFWGKRRPPTFPGLERHGGPGSRPPLGPVDISLVSLQIFHTLKIPWTDPWLPIGLVGPLEVGFPTRPRTNLFGSGFWRLVRGKGTLPVGPPRKGWIWGPFGARSLHWLGRWFGGWTGTGPFFGFQPGRPGYVVPGSFTVVYLGWQRGWGFSRAGPFGVKPRGGSQEGAPFGEVSRVPFRRGPSSISHCGLRGARNWFPFGNPGPGLPDPDPRKHLG